MIDGLVVVAGVLSVAGLILVAYDVYYRYKCKHKSGETVYLYPEGDGVVKEVSKGSTDHLLWEIEKLKRDVGLPNHMVDSKVCDVCGCIVAGGRWVVGQSEVRTRRISRQEWIENRNRESVRIVPPSIMGMDPVFFEEDYVYYPHYCKEHTPKGAKS